jgi:hypothetical protein
MGFMSRRLGLFLLFCLALPVSLTLVEWRVLLPLREKPGKREKLAFPYEKPQVERLKP